MFQLRGYSLASFWFWYWSKAISFTSPMVTRGEPEVIGAGGGCVVFPINLTWVLLRKCQPADAVRVEQFWTYKPNGSGGFGQYVQRITFSGLMMNSHQLSWLPCGCSLWWEGEERVSQVRLVTRAMYGVLSVLYFLMFENVWVTCWSRSRITMKMFRPE